jgi:aspartyl/asparaginyl beta-hydroxylase
VLSAIRLPITFDAEGLRADLDGLTPDDWIPHFNTFTYEGDWSGLALRSVGGVAKQLYPDPTATEEFADTSYLERCPATRAALDAFDCQLLSARFLKLAVGATIREHRDLNLGYEDGELRVHVPVQTNPDVEFLLEGRRIDMQEGEAWYLDLNLPHAVANRGETDRVHLVVDCVVNEWVRAQLEQGEAAGG